MASYRYESSRIGDVVLYEDKKLLVQKSPLYSNPCYHCFFVGDNCSGIACKPHVRIDRENIIYHEISSIGR